MKSTTGGLMRNVLAAVDDTEGSRKAAEFAHDLAHRFQARLTLLHVIDPLPSAALTAFGVPASDLYSAEVRRAEAFLRELASELGAEEAEQVIEIGKPGEIICTAADERDADHIVLGSHGHGGIARLMLGSVGARVATLATRPVTIVR